MNRRCDCCGERRDIDEYDAVFLCKICGDSWKNSAARTVATKERKPDFDGALRQFIDGKSCFHYIGKQLPAQLMEQMP